MLNFYSKKLIKKSNLINKLELFVKNFIILNNIRLLIVAKILLLF